MGRVTSTNSRLAKAIYLRRGRGGGSYFPALVIRLCVTVQGMVCK